MRARDRVAGVVAGLVSGAAGGLFGVGGGIVLIPILTARFGLTQHQAHGTSLAVMGVTALASLLVYGGHAEVAWRTAVGVAAASVFTARYGARWATRTTSTHLRRAFATLLALVAVRLLLKVPEAGGHPFGTGVGGLAFDLAVGTAVGLLSGYMGVGGGILAVPAFTLGLRMTQQAAQGTSLAVILVTGPAGALEHARHGNVVGRLVPTLAAGAVVGGPLASWLAQWLSHGMLSRAFALFLLVNAAVTWGHAPGRSAVPGSDPVRASGASGTPRKSAKRRRGG